MKRLRPRILEPPSGAKTLSGEGILRSLEEVALSVPGLFAKGENASLFSVFFVRCSVKASK